MSQRQHARAMPPKQQYQQPQRMPQPSIKSSQVFSQQQPQRQQQRQNLSQQTQRHYQTQQQDYFDDNSSEKEGMSGPTKMTITQAITLITLRLGSIETKLMNMNSQNYGSSMDNSFSDNGLIERLEQLENKINLNTNINTNDNLNYKQQIDSLTQTLIQFKKSTNLIINENKEIKNQLTNYKLEIEELKKTLENVKQMAISNETKIIQMLSNDLSNDDENDAFDNNLENNELNTSTGEITFDINDTNIENAIVENNEQIEDVNCDNSIQL